MTEAMRQDALSRRLELDRLAARKSGIMPQASGVEARSIGQLAELAVAAWLRRSGLEVEHHGGIDGRPDLEVAGVALGVKFFSRTGGDWRPHYRVHVFDRHLHHADEWALAGSAPSPDNLLLLGFATRALVLEGRPVPAGVRLASGFVPVEPIHEVTVGDLDDPHEWVRAHGGTTPAKGVHVTSGAEWDERRNTSRRIPPEPGALERALEACAELRRRDPALVKWIEDGHPTLTEAEHIERFGKPYGR